MTVGPSLPGTSPFTFFAHGGARALWQHARMQEARTPLTAKLVASLYTEAMLLADEARSYFDMSGRADRDSLDPIDRVGFSCESLKVTTRLMHVIAWLLTQRAVEAGELSRKPGAPARPPPRRRARQRRGPAAPAARKRARPDPRQPRPLRPGQAARRSRRPRPGAPGEPGAKPDEPAGAVALTVSPAFALSSAFASSYSRIISRHIVPRRPHPVDRADALARAPDVAPRLLGARRRRRNPSSSDRPRADCRDRARRRAIEARR